MATVFSRIIAGEIPSYKVAEDENHYAFLDISPKAIGHTLVVPKREIDYLFDLPKEELASLMGFAQRVANAIKMAYPCPKVAMMVLGLEVPHAHIHLFPLEDESILSRSEQITLSESDFNEIASRIASCFC